MRMIALAAVVAVGCGAGSPMAPTDTACRVTYNVEAAPGMDSAALAEALTYFTASTSGLVHFTSAPGPRTVRLRIDPSHPRIAEGYSGYTEAAAAAEGNGAGAIGTGTITFQSSEVTASVGLVLHEIGHLWLGSEHSTDPADLMCAVGTAGPACAITPGRRFSPREQRVLYETARSEARPGPGCAGALD